MKLFEGSVSTMEDNNNSDEQDVEKVVSVEKLPEPVYYVESPDDDTVLIGIDVTIDHSKGEKEGVSKVSWYDTVHERVMMASETVRKDSYFAFKRSEREGGGVYYFAPMNLKIYNERVKQYLDAGRDFENNNDLTKAFLDTLEDEV